MRDTVPSTTAPTSRSAILAPFHSPGGSFPHPGRQANGHYPIPSIAASSTPGDRKRSGGKVPSGWTSAPAPARGGAGASGKQEGADRIGSGQVWSGQVDVYA